MSNRCKYVLRRDKDGNPIDVCCGYWRTNTRKGKGYTTMLIEHNEKCKFRKSNYKRARL
jgi:hypothetical protein